MNTESAAKQIAGFLARYDPAVARKARSIRSAMRKRLPTAQELVYDNYQFLVFGFGPNERASEAIVSLAVSPKGVALCFLQGAGLPDPGGILLGSGKRNRFVRLESARTLDEPRVAALFRAALARAKTPLPATGRARTIIKAISAKQRPRRANS